VLTACESRSGAVEAWPVLTRRVDAMRRAGDAQYPLMGRKSGEGEPMRDREVEWRLSLAETESQSRRLTVRGEERGAIGSLTLPAVSTASVRRCNKNSYS
jgi:hypothetical protein